MNLLLDTHTFLWLVNGNAELSSNARALIEDLDNERLLSVASIWEIAIKVNLGKLSVTGSFDEFISRQTENNSITLLNILVSHTAMVVTLPLHHRDPFDRMLAAQSMVEHLPIVSRDVALVVRSDCY